MKILTGFAVINDSLGKKIAYTSTEVDNTGMVIKSNMKQSFAVIDQTLLDAIKIIEKDINERLEKQED